MCYDISFKSKVGDLSDYFPDMSFDDQLKFEFTPTEHIFGYNYDNHPIIYISEDFRKTVRAMHWAYIPPQIDDLKSFEKLRTGMLNAKSEKIFSDPRSYWFKIKNQRCLIPVDAIYEHRELATFSHKIPYHITLKDQAKFFIPGLYGKNYHVQGSNNPYWSFTMLTREAKENWVMREIHNGHSGEDRFRMVLMLPFELSELFLSPDLSDSDYKMILNYEMPAEDLDYYTVASVRSRKPRPDGKPKDAFFDWGIPKITNQQLAKQARLF